MISAVRTVGAIFIACGMLGLCTAAPAADAPVAPNADGWVGMATVWHLHQATSPAVLDLHGMVPQEVGAVTLTVEIDGGRPISQAQDPGEFGLHCLLTGPSADHEVVLRADKQGTLPSPDGRSVSARILRIALDPIRSLPSCWTPDSDITPVGGPVGLGAGWYQLESWHGASFRWLDKQGELGLALPAVDAPAHAHGVLTLTVQPGPGTNGQPARVCLEDKDGKILDQVEVAKRMQCDLVVPHAALANQPLLLLVQNGGTLIPGDHRNLDLQVFSMSWTP